MTRTTQLVAAGLLAAATLGVPASLLAQRSGVEIWQQNCGSCHALQPPNRYTADLWETVMTEMRLAARLSDAEADKVLEFLKAGARSITAETPAPTPAAQFVSAGPVTLPRAHQPDGGVVFSKWCVACHGEQGKGDGPAASAFDPKPANFTDAKFWDQRTEAQVEEVIEHGKNAMPAFAAQLNHEEIFAVIRYLKELGRQAAEAKAK